MYHKYKPIKLESTGINVDYVTNLFGLACLWSSSILSIESQIGIMASFTSPPGTPAPLTRYSSRVRQSPISSPWKSSRGVAPTSTRLSSPPINDQQNTFMDADETEFFRTEKSVTRTRDEKIFAKSSELTVSSYATLPVEVREVLQNAGMGPCKQ